MNTVDRTTLVPVGPHKPTAQQLSHAVASFDGDGMWMTPVARIAAPTVQTHWVTHGPMPLSMANLLPLDAFQQDGLGAVVRVGGIAQTTRVNPGQAAAAAAAAVAAGLVTVTQPMVQAVFDAVLVMADLEPLVILNLLGLQVMPRSIP